MSPFNLQFYLNCPKPLSNEHRKTFCAFGALLPLCRYFLVKYGCSFTNIRIQETFVGHILRELNFLDPIHYLFIVLRFDQQYTCQGVQYMDGYVCNGSDWFVFTLQISASLRLSSLFLTIIILVVLCRCLRSNMVEFSHAKL